MYIIFVKCILIFVVWKYVFCKICDIFIVMHDILILNIIYETVAYDTDGDTIDNTGYGIICNLIYNASNNAYDLLSGELHRICRNYPDALISYSTLMKSISM